MTELLQVRLQKADLAASRYKANSRFGYRRSPKVTKDSKLMEERNAVVNAATKMMLSTGLETSEAKAHARSQEGYVRRFINDLKHLFFLANYNIYSFEGCCQRTGQFHLRSEWLVVIQKPQGCWHKSALKRKERRRRLTVIPCTLSGNMCSNSKLYSVYP